MLRHLHLSRKALYGLILTFALGIVTIAVNLGRFVEIQTTHNNWNAVFVWSMAELAVAIIVVSLPALKTLLRRNGNSTSAHSKSYSHGNGANASSQQRSDFGGNAPSDDTGSDVELNQIGKSDVIYETKEISIDSRPMEDQEDGSRLSRSWTNSGYHVRAGNSEF